MSAAPSCRKRQSLTDTRHLFSAVRMLPDGRLHVSAHGPAFGREPPPTGAASMPASAGCSRSLAQLSWSQGVERLGGDDPEHFPRLHELAPGLFAGLGYNGRGIAAATMMGRDLAALVRGAADAATVFPLMPLRPLRLAPRRAGAGAGAGAGVSRARHGRRISPRACCLSGG